MLEFWLSFLMALLGGSVYSNEISAIDSTLQTPQVIRYAEWLCGEEICFINLDTGKTGP